MLPPPCLTAETLFWLLAVINFAFICLCTHLIRNMSSKGDDSGLLQSSFIVFGNLTVTYIPLGVSLFSEHPKQFCLSSSKV